jgi:hypothetical protein
MSCVGDVGESLARLEYALGPPDHERDDRGENDPVEKHPEKRDQQKSLGNVLKEFEEIAHGSPSSMYAIWLQNSRQGYCGSQNQNGQK